jgi:hypothetical protein
MGGWVGPRAGMNMVVGTKETPVTQHVLTELSQLPAGVLGSNPTWALDAGLSFFAITSSCLILSICGNYSSAMEIQEQYSESIIKVKVKLSLYFIKHNAMKMYGGVEV